MTKFRIKYAPDTLMVIRGANSDDINSALVITFNVLDTDICNYSIYNHYLRRSKKEKQSRTELLMILN